MTKTTKTYRGVLTGANRMLRDEMGGATAWNIVWLTNFAVIAGVAIDTGNARRVQTQLTSTADVAALAGVMELPAPHLELPYNSGGYVAVVENEAKKFAVQNLATNEVNGTYFIEDEDVFVGHWDHANRQFTWGGGEDKPVNAVQVFMGRNDAKNNRLSTSVLHMMGLTSWEINTTATAMMSIPNCFRNGVVAGNLLKLNSNATIYPGACLHGEQEVEIQNNNTWYEGTAVSGGWQADMRISPNQADPNGAPHEVNQIRGHILPSEMVNDIINVGRALLDLQDNYNDYNPDYRFMRVAEMQDPNQPVIEMDEFTIGDTVPPSDPEQTWLDDGVEVASLGGLLNLSAPGGGGNCNPNNGGGNNKYILDGMRQHFDDTVCPGANLEEFRTYYAPCGNKLTINGTVRNVVIVSECKVTVSNGSVIENSMIVVLDDGKHKTQVDMKAMHSGQGVRYGAKDGCAPGGGVRLWVRGDFHTAADTEWYGTQVYVANDFHLAGKTDSSQSISAHVGNDAHIAAQAQISAYDPDQSFAYDELACVGNVDFDWITSDYHYVLVD